MTAALGALVALGAVACDDEPELVPPMPVTPTFNTYTDDAMPRSDLPEPEDGVDLADTLSAPLPQLGDDTGEDGIVYQAVLGGYYLIRVQEPSGHFQYSFNVDDDAWADDDSIHRQCGTTYTQATLLTATGREEFRLSTEWAMRYLLSESTEQDDGTLKLTDMGGTSLFMLSLTEYAFATGTDAWDDTINALGRYLLDRLNDDGTVIEGSNFQWSQGTQALWRYYKFTGDEAILDKLEARLRWMYENPQGEGGTNEDEQHYLIGLWAQEPLANLYEVRPADWIAEYAFRLADVVVDLQHTSATTETTSWHGGISPSADDTPTWRTALYLEGVADAYRTAVMHGDTERVERYRDSMLLAVPFLRALQFRRGETDSFGSPDLIIGAVPFSRKSRTLRVDVTHHWANTLLKVVNDLDLEDYPGKE